MPHKLIHARLIIILFLVLSNAYANEDKTSKKEAFLMSQEAILLMQKGNYEQSLIQSRRALTMAIHLKDNKLIANCYNTIAANFDQLSEYDKAFFYYNKGLIYADKTNDDELKNWLNNNLGNIYCFDKKQYEKGIYHYKRSLQYSTNIKDSAQIVFTNLNLTWAYFDIGQYKQGVEYLNYVNKHHDKHGTTSTVVALNMLNGMYQSYQNNIDKAQSYFNNAILLGNEGNEKSDLSYSHLEFSKFLFKNNNYKEAYTHLLIYNAINEELEDEEKHSKANVAGINLQIDEYKREIDKIEIEYKTKEQSHLQQQSKNKKILVVLIALLIMLFFLFYFYAQNAKLKHNNKLKDIQSKIQENIINATINGQEVERKKIAAFLHDNISALLSSAGMHLFAHIKQNETSSQEIIKTKSILAQAHDQVRDLSHELMPSLLAQFGLFEALDDLCEKNSNSILQFKYSSTVDKTTRYEEDYEMKIYFIIMELLNNITKHSEAEHAKISLQERNGSLKIVIIDSGKGFDTKEFKVLEGFGLNQIKARLNNLKGGIVINSKINVGTTIKMTIPIVYLKKLATPVFQSQ
ncbi:Histidine kinase [Flavobacterium micromati]|uniref:histidine kinase n=1 Tax=Flavobacterium micromati TaxID=229205 RepID=A0A1M5QIN5_9FLAO|nr:tetratricopeptide repeat-containing sensor histidine kinase [Flavobacterium micromati]SHH13650.1 Histidine kinase [Flavobacterium micromati]